MHKSIVPFDPLFLLIAAKSGKIGEDFLSLRNIEGYIVRTASQVIARRRARKGKKEGAEGDALRLGFGAMHGTAGASVAGVSTILTGSFAKNEE